MVRKVAFWVVISSICLAMGTAYAGPKAKNPDPADGALSVNTPLLRWAKGDNALFHNVYLGTAPELTEAELVGKRLAIELYYHAPQFQPGSTYFWRVDEIQIDGTTVVTGDVWTFMTQALTAYHPGPADGAADTGLAPVLTWLPGTGAVQHHVYFGDNLDAVTQGAAGVDKGVLEQAVTSFTPGNLEDVKTYYWRVDEILADKSIRTGPVWKFTTFLNVDDFEGYTDDEGSRIYESWIDGYADQSSGSTVGHIDAPFAERQVIHGGSQSMPVEYNNVNAPFYSEAVKTWDTPMDWSAGGVTTLTLYFRGRSSNSVEKLYVKVEDDRSKAGVAVYPVVTDIAVPVWTRWEIPLTTFGDAGVDLAAVESLYIGVGDPENPVAGGTGVLFFDDIYVGGPGPAIGTSILFAEDFEGLVLGPKVDEGEPGLTVWTGTPPVGWTVDDSGVPGIADPATDGVTEWAGWGFANKDWWVKTAGDQNRSQFTKGMGTVAIADPDEWDDMDHPDGAVVGWYKAFMTTSPIDVSAAKGGSLSLTFDSSWRPEFDDDYHQTANVTVSFDGGPAEEVFRWESDSASPRFKTDATNETVTFKLNAPAGAKSMVLTFGLFDAGNDWWWAVDNIMVTGKTN